MKSFVDTIIVSPIYSDSNGSSKHDPFEAVTWENLCVGNRSFAWSLYFDKKKHEKEVQADIDRYNDWLGKVVSLEGFKEYFFGHNSYVCLNEVCNKWGVDAKKLLENIPYGCFSIPFIIYDGYLWDHLSGTKYKGVVNGIPVTVDFVILNNKVLKEKKLKELWNLQDTPRDDFNIGIRECLDDNNLIPQVEDSDGDLYSPYIEYGERNWQEDEDSSFAMLGKCTRLLESMNYLQRYLLKPDREDVRWRYYFQKSGTIEYGLLDLSFVKDKLVMEKIKLLLAPDFYKESGEYGPIFFLTDNENKQYISESPGAIGGHKKLKIYGRLDCPSANRYVAKGEYVRHRVFFKDEDTAIAAGYRPCGTCMTKAYKKRKDVNKQ